MRRLAWARFALLAGVVLIMGASCSFATRRTVTTDTTWSPFLQPGLPDSTNLAETSCENGRVVVRKDDQGIMKQATLTGLTEQQAFRAVWEHERTHVEDLHTNPALSCEQNAGLMWGSPPRYAFAEARAYCAELRYRYYKTTQKGDFLLALMRAAEVVNEDIMAEKEAWPKLSEDVGPEVAALFIRVCPFVTVVEPRR